MSELKGIPVFAVTDEQEDGSFFVKKSIRDGGLAVFDEIKNAETQVKVNDCDNGVRECFLVRRETFDKVQDQITQLEKDKADLLAVLPNLISGWDYEELAHCGGVDDDTAARVIKLVGSAE